MPPRCADSPSRRGLDLRRGDEDPGATLVTDDASADRGAYQPIIRLGRVGPAIFVPLRVRGQATGTLMVANLKGGTPLRSRAPSGWSRRSPTRPRSPSSTGAPRRTCGAWA